MHPLDTQSDWDEIAWGRKLQVSGRHEVDETGSLDVHPRAGEEPFVEVMPDWVVSLRYGQRTSPSR